MKALFKPGQHAQQVNWKILGISFFSLILSCASLWANWFEFKVSWDPPKLIMDIDTRQVSYERIGLFSGAAVGGQAVGENRSCYSRAACGTFYQDTLPRLHQSKLTPLQGISLALFLIPALVVTTLVVLTNLVFLFLSGWKAILSFLVIVPTGVVLLGLLLPPVFLLNYITQTINGGDSLPEWNRTPAGVRSGCQPDYQQAACAKTFNDTPAAPLRVSEADVRSGCVTHNPDGTCSFQSVEQTQFLGAGGKADWELVGLVPAGPLLLMTSLLLIGAAIWARACRRQ